jgi:hypothetical protein
MFDLLMGEAVGSLASGIQLLSDPTFSICVYLYSHDFLRQPIRYIRF